MQAINLEDIDSPDFVALDKEGQVILIAEVKGFPFNFTDEKTKKYAILRLVDYLQIAKESFRLSCLLMWRTFSFFNGTVRICQN